MSFFIELHQYHEGEVCQQLNSKQTVRLIQSELNVKNPTDIQKAVQWALNGLSTQKCQLQVDNQRIIVNVLLSEIFRGLTFIQKAQINLKHFKIRFDYHLLNRNGVYNVVSSRQRRTFAAKLLLTFNIMAAEMFNEYKMTVNMENGLIKLSTPLFYTLTQKLSNLPSLLKFYVNHFTKNIKYLYQPLLNLLQMSNADPQNYRHYLQYSAESIRGKKLQKYTKLRNLFLNTGSEAKDEEQSLSLMIKKEQESLVNLRTNQMALQQHMFGGRLFYQQNSRQNLQVALDAAERKYILDRLEIPQVKAMMASRDKRFISNHIILMREILEKDLRLIASGGFANIYLTEVEFYPIGSHKQNQQEIIIEPQEVKRRQFILKRQIPNKKQGSHNRQLHQRQILKKLKSALAVFVPKYYFIKDPPDSCRNDLLIQPVYLYPPKFTLEDYFSKFKQTISQQTIIYFACMIVQALRYLKQYSVVHLDLKLSNILIGRQLILKLIDFGQSYHPSLTNHSPGVTLPYSPPQVIDPKQHHFTSKSDVYSFGVILHYLLIGNYPFYLYSDQLRRQLYKGNIDLSDRWFFCPEGQSQYGQNKIFPYLQLIIGKCLHSDPTCRPQLQWISLMLREYNEYFR